MLRREFDFSSLKLDLKKYRIESENPEIWKDPNAKSLFQKIKNIENKIRDFEIIESNIEYLKRLLSLQYLKIMKNTLSSYCRV